MIKRAQDKAQSFGKELMSFSPKKAIAVGGISALSYTQAHAVDIDTAGILSDITDVGNAGVQVVLAIVAITIVIVLLRKVF